MKLNNLKTFNKNMYKKNKNALLKMKNPSKC